MWLRLRNVEGKKKEFALSSSLGIPDLYLLLESPDTFLLLGDPRLLINLPRNLLSQLHQLIFQLVLPYTLYFTTGVLSIFLYKASSFTYWEYFILSLFLKGISQGDALLSLIASVVHSSWNYNVITYPIFKNNRSMLSLISFNTLIRCLPH